MMRKFPVLIFLVIILFLAPAFGIQIWDAATQTGNAISLTTSVAPMSSREWMYASSITNGQWNNISICFWNFGSSTGTELNGVHICERNATNGYNCVPGTRSYFPAFVLPGSTGSVCQSLIDTSYIVDGSKDYLIGLYINNSVGNLYYDQGVTGDKYYIASSNLTNQDEWTGLTTSDFYLVTNMSGEAVSSSSSCIAHWSFNNTNGLNDDCSGTWNLTTFNGPTSGVVGVFDEAYSFDGVNDGATIGDLDLLTSWTICFWVKPNSVAVEHAYFSKYNPGVGDKDTNYLITAPSANASMRLFVGDGVTYYMTYSNVSLSTGSWFHVCTWWDNGTSTAGFWINNSRAGEGASSSTMPNNAVSATIANNNLGHTADATIDDVWVLGSVITPSQVSNLFNYGNLTGIPPPTVGCSIALNAPANNANDTDATPTFNYTTTCDGVPSRCYVIIDGAQQGDNSSDIVNGSANYITSNVSLANGVHSWNVTCASNTSSTRTLNLWSTNNMSFSGILVNGLPNTTVNPTEAGNSIVTVEFNVTDDSGAGNIELVSAWANITTVGISNTSCMWNGYVSGNTKGIACQLAMPYYISGGLKTVQVYAADIYGWSVNDSGHNFSYNTIYAVSLNSSTLNMGVFNPGTTWNLATQAQRITNTGNGAVNVSITGAHLVNGTYVWGIGNFSVSSIPGPPLAMNLTTGSQNYSPVGGILVNATYDVWYFVDATASIPARAYSAVWQWVTSAA